MTKKTGLGHGFFSHGYDLSGDVGSVNDASSPRGVLPITGIDKSAEERLLGLSDGKIDISTWFNDAAGQEHTALSGLVSTDQVLLWQFGGAVGDVACTLVAKQTNYDPSRGQDGSLSFNVQGQGNATPLEWMRMLSAGKITHSSATSSTSKDDSASSSNGIRACLQMVDISSGTPTASKVKSTPIPWVRSRQAWTGSPAPPGNGNDSMGPLDIP